MEANLATNNGHAGLEIHGTCHAVSLNVANLNTGTGLEMLGTAGSRFDSQPGGEPRRLRHVGRLRGDGHRRHGQHV